MSDTVSFTLDGEEIKAQTDETIWEIAKRRFHQFYRLIA